MTDGGSSDLISDTVKKLVKSGIIIGTITLEIVWR